MAVSAPKTFFAPAERIPKDEVLCLSTRLRRSLLSNWFDAIPIPILIINDCRQIIFCNAAFRHIAAASHEQEELIGLRPGEALGCIHADIMEGGCGTSRFCRHCGAAIAILECLRGKTDVHECNIQRDASLPSSTLDYQIYTSPVEFEGARFVLFCVIDISHEKRLTCIERNFFHDAINMVSAAGSISDLSGELPDTDMRDLLKHLGSNAHGFMEDLVYFKDIRAAECGKLQADPGSVNVAELVGRMRDHFIGGEPPSSKDILITADGTPTTIETDRRLLRHVLRSMLQNALEATPQDGAVTVSISEATAGLAVRVHNQGYMPEDIQEKLFKRYFSTKGEGRGLGTYFMRLFAQRHLGGSVSFESSPQGGTVFTVVLPRTLPRPGQA